MALIFRLHIDIVDIGQSFLLNTLDWNQVLDPYDDN